MYKAFQKELIKGLPYMDLYEFVKGTRPLQERALTVMDWKEPKNRKEFRVYAAQHLDGDPDQLIKRADDWVKFLKPTTRDLS